MGEATCSTASSTGAPAKDDVRHVKGSHIVVPRVHTEAHAYILQNADNRIVFVIPYHDRYSLIGTTDVAGRSLRRPGDLRRRDRVSAGARRTPISNARSHAADIVWTYSGVRPLYDDGVDRSVGGNARLRAQGRRARRRGRRPERAPVLSIFGGKITTYRKLAEHALAELAPYFASMKPAVDAQRDAARRRPAGSATAQAWLADAHCRRYPQLPAPLLRALARSSWHARGRRARRREERPRIWARISARNSRAREIDYLSAEEWARTADDVLWRRTKCGLPMTQAQARDASPNTWQLTRRPSRDGRRAPQGRPKVRATPPWGQRRGISRKRGGRQSACDARDDARRRAARHQRSC